ncbi:uncharacterized protein L3040_002016 [Drepanopeziza brunnea f. sp. 'multigermtubi']|uniref:CT20 family protein n=1 Tax=Marssonina brunnea f. sp. multigermtubi (strain MB_m1) TaxID=1072389 RepID=K1X373_MARBU|nr:CT20 family protein [Drepanopeziza brunnea f. sp. 'multigermtubi' MB_m1]EKD19641.1 CT20 family protein [Drepanopeziza brunnea f. sp. 'multigermtubi' MB_m1]KAJ5052262.1 hypothetical protein L3040_002016 [Drepanopeziza brunnea f. sp. 'multigermtubi']
MPPRGKKTKGSARAPSTPAGDDDIVATALPQTEKSASNTPKPAYNILNDPWTDEQETSLFKGIIKWKPAGIHKHFRMIALSEHLRNHGYDPAVEQHTRIPGIWQKLRTIYNLDVIDDRENSFEYDDPDKFLDFKLPEKEYGEAMFMKGRRSAAQEKASEAPSSPPQLGRSSSPPVLTKRKRAETVTVKNRAGTGDTDGTRTSPALSPPPKAIRVVKNTNKPIGRLKGASAASSRRQSKETTATAETADEDEGGEETEGAVEDEGEDAEEEDGTASPKPLKAAKAKPDPPTRKSRRKK